MPRLRLKSSFSTDSAAVMSSLTWSRLMMSSTRAVLMLTLAAWLLAFAAEWSGVEWRVERSGEGRGRREGLKPQVSDGEMKEAACMLVDHQWHYI